MGMLRYVHPIKQSRFQEPPRDNPILGPPWWALACPSYGYWFLWTRCAWCIRQRTTLGKTPQN